MDREFPDPGGRRGRLRSRKRQSQVGGEELRRIEFFFPPRRGDEYRRKGERRRWAPLPNVLLGLQPKGKRALQAWQFVYTNLEGDYQLENIPPGEYLIVVNGNGDISSYAPFPKAYYPGVFKEEIAAVVKATRGDRLENYDINIPSQATTHTIQGMLLYADGRPVEKGYVQFKADKVEEGTVGEVRTQADAQGRFSLNILQGLDGRLYGFIYLNQDEYANCPALQKLVTDSISLLETESLRLKITADMQGVELLFSIVPCEKPKQK